MDPEYGILEMMGGICTSYYCCKSIKMSSLVFNGRVDIENFHIRHCCDSVRGKPQIAFKETTEDTLRDFMGERDLLLAECLRSPEDNQRYFSAGCVQCHKFRQIDDYPTNGLIQHINLSLYPSPCQSRCIYCSIYNADPRTSAAAQAGYEKVFDLVDMAERCGVVDPNALWTIACGEITIHPYRERIMKLVRGKCASFATNCMKFDEDIAQTLHDNPNSSINFSIDAGTSETWKKVKGIDNFDKVTENLDRYCKQSADPGQIKMKYIILPGINDNDEDYRSLMGIMKTLEVKHLTISRDFRGKYSISREDQIKLTSAAAHLLAACHKNGVSGSIYSYSEKEEKEVFQLAEHML